jgi:hypothetical protein
MLAVATVYVAGFMPAYEWLDSRHMGRMLSSSYAVLMPSTGERVVARLYDPMLWLCSKSRAMDKLFGRGQGWATPGELRELGPILSSHATGP